MNDQLPEDPELTALLQEQADIREAYNKARVACSQAQDTLMQLKRQLSELNHQVAAKQAARETLESMSEEQIAETKRLLRATGE